MERGRMSVTSKRERAMKSYVWTIVAVATTYGFFLGYRFIPSLDGLFIIGVTCVALVKCLEEAADAEYFD